MSAAAVTIRLAAAADAAALRRLAALDSTRPPDGRLIVAEVDGEIRVALPLDGGPPVADPFVLCAELIDLLRVRAAQLRPPATPPRGRAIARLRAWPRATRSIASRGASRPRSAAI